MHRDIKPENILLASGKARVADFGIARARSESQVSTSRLPTRTWPWGHLSRMSPEQASGSESLDQRTDIYSLGCVLYAMLAGEPPFSARTPQAIIAKHLGEKSSHPRGRSARSLAAGHHDSQKGAVQGASG